MSESEPLFALSAEKRGYPKSLMLMNLTFAEILDTIVKPYEENEPFFIDGVPLTRDEVQKLKIVQQGSDFSSAYGAIRRSLNNRDMKAREITAKHYDVMLGDVMRGCGRDVTSLVIRAYGSKVRPGLARYLPDRDTLIRSAFTLFNEWAKSLG